MKKLYHTHVNHSLRSILGLCFKSLVMLPFFSWIMLDINESIPSFQQEDCLDSLFPGESFDLALFVMPYPPHRLRCYTDVQRSVWSACHDVVSPCTVALPGFPPFL